MEQDKGARKTMHDILPGWGDFLDGLADHLQREDPEGWAAMVEAVSAQAIEAGTAKTAGLGPKDESAVHAPEQPQETNDD